MGASMRGSDATSGSLFSYVDLESRVPAKHPLRVIKVIVDDVLMSLDAEFERLYEGTGRQSIAPERLLRASLLQAFYSVRSERQLMEQIDYNLLFRWFVGLGIDDPVWDHSTFSKNRDRLLDADVAAKFLEAVLRHPKVKRFLSDDHFSVDGTLVEAWASLKSFRAKDGSDEPPSPGRNGERDFHGEKRANETHESKTDPDAKLFRKGNNQSAKLYFMGHALIENRNGLVARANRDSDHDRLPAGAAVDTLGKSPQAAFLSGRPTGSLRRTPPHRLLHHPGGRRPLWLCPALQQFFMIAQAPNRPSLWFRFRDAMSRDERGDVLRPVLQRLPLFDRIVVKIVGSVADPLRFVVLDDVPDLTRDAERGHSRLDRCPEVLRGEGFPFEASGLK
jgi:transposase